MAYDIGIDIGGTKVLFMTLDREGKPITYKAPTGTSFKPEDLNACMVTFVNMLPGSKAIRDTTIAVCGLVEGSQIQICELPLMNGSNLATIVCPFMTGELKVINDGEAAIYGAIDESDEKDNLAVIVCGTGIGAGFIVDGKVIEGGFGFAGEVESMPVLVDGSYIAIRKVCSGSYVVEQLQSMGIHPENVNDIIENKLEGYQEVSKLLCDMASRFAQLTVTTMMFLSSKVIIAGGGCFSFIIFREAVIHRVNALVKTLPSILQNTTFKISKDANTLVVRGALNMNKHHP